MAHDESQSVVRFERVTVRFDETKALDDVSFEVASGETRVIFGAAGSGKTVLLKTALGLIQPDSGTVRVFGQELGGMRETDLFRIRSRIGVLFQEGGLFDSLTVEENVGYPLENLAEFQLAPAQVRQRAAEALRFVELEQTLDKFPAELSGGMRRRVGIARAVVTEPPLVLYDSPTAGLDPITAYTIIELLIKERDLSQTTTLLVTQRYQDGNLIANFRYNSKQGRIEPARNGAGRAMPTTFMVLRDGRLVFEGDQDRLESSTDPYISKFVKRRV